ncbi:MAG: cupredoxin domain-containing protein [Deltaproteobacteria bacterium]|nr:cupredoxin domain-containing protein [Deltaproteobacteria bacterium]
MNKTLLCITLALALACRREAPSQPPAQRPLEVSAPAGARVPVEVDGEGYHPARIKAPAGARLTLVFRRTTDETCGQQVQFPSLNVRHDLPLNQPVEVAVTVPASGSLGFTCGMNMYQGSVLVQ